jgi:formamidopyrimidine-DNA glycosylase
VPELPEVEVYRRLAERALHRTISDVSATDGWFLKGGLDEATVTAGLLGASFTTARRIGKLLLLDTDGGPTLGLHFGMSGRLVVDGVAGVYDLLYSSNQELERYDRFSVTFDDGGHLRVRDPRRLGGVHLDPNEAKLGPDALTVSAPALRDLLAGSVVPLKARLMDQRRLAGVGNLLADEILWRASLSPIRPAQSLSPAEVRRLHKHLRGSVEELLARGGSHMGDMLSARAPGGRCPRCDGEMRRDTVGGRTTWWCPAHQH